ncbi:Arginine N-methyltransferase 2 [Puccinia graminis f. sp. tritici]|uniref:Arginine N-methyltransferase 2 n=2 Tax=Puccinia graminis f. sp. tritici TaxID=56615 RepID=A0A5B0M776_PUCGR|nr:Arginine N-methyltransferase 2 [Puccinia graminis f. sp. tritici]
MRALIGEVIADEEGRRGYHSFLAICESGQLSEIKEVLQQQFGSDSLPSLSLQDDDGWTALHYAAKSGNPRAVEYLLQQGALWAMVDNLGYNAGDVAFSMNHVEVYQIISNHGFRAEALRLTMEATYPEEEGATEAGSTATNNARFLASKLTFKTSASGQRLCIDSEGNGVMQGWETEIMRETAKRLCEPFLGRNKTSDFELSILNVGFGLGIIDSFFQQYHPARHVIIEPHPDVLQFISDQGWPDKPGVHIYPGRWQDFLQDVKEGKIQADFDVIYWDTFSEDYRSLKGFFDNVFDLLSGSEARFSWFHGLGATSRTLYDIYTEMAEMDMREAGLRVSWSKVPVDGGEAVWEGIKRRYWDIPSPYRLPICTYDV